jgi:hypothetical protein
MEQERRFNILCDYEVGRSISAIELIGRGTKPLAEIGNTKISDSEIRILENDIKACLAIANEPGVKGFLAEQKDGRWSYGFFREPWVEEALLFIDAAELPAYHRHWISGLLFGYNPGAIQRFLRSDASNALGSIEPHDDTLSRGETSLPCSGRSRNHSSLPYRFLTVDLSDL